MASEFFMNGRNKAIREIATGTFRNSDIKRAYYAGGEAKKKGKPRSAVSKEMDDNFKPISGEAKEEWLRGYDEA